MCPKSNSIVERFDRTLLEEFYQIVMLKNIYTSLDELQDDLDKFIYNITILKERIKGTAYVVRCLTRNSWMVREN
jgi:hypothetical protein